MTAVADSTVAAKASFATTRTAAELIAALAALPAGHPSRPALRDRVIAAWFPLAGHLARRYAGRGEPADDLYQVAVMGLIKAVDRFEVGRGVEFVAFAIPTVIGELKRHFRDRTWSIRVPRRLQELRLAITGANSHLTHSLGRSPTVADIAAHLNLSEEEVLEGLEGARAYTATSLSTPANDEGSTTLGDTLGGEDAGFELAELRIALGPALASLDEREQKIVCLRFYGNLTQSEIARQVGVSQMHVSRLLGRSLAKLRAKIDSGG
ncbi:SigB/SigF/SigG family RNA polymerase sigma factor [Actinoplanes subtropicus]|uniref:SigB/SigF/SigG family RNA polymerase sigma factor n=1 Tax=Actinoplanes subtropicus TaxID=543632 RepID=UPI0004C476BF|nr:SigB/SigF/SigG family RNA polymerase sigma factor [Actinoplanes subtropicus]